MPVEFTDEKENSFELNIDLNKGFLPKLSTMNTFLVRVENYQLVF